MGNDPSSHKNCLRVITISPNSPASKTDLQPFTDFIVNIFNPPSDFNISTDFYKYVIQHENQEIKILVFNLLTGINRLVLITPSRIWPQADFLLGFQYRIENTETVQLKTFRISGVQNEVSRILFSLDSDFFIGIKELIFRDFNELKRKLAYRKTCNVVIYSLKSNSVREIEIVCTNGLGLEFSTGFMHDLIQLYRKNVLFENELQRKKYIQENGGGELEKLVKVKKVETGNISLLVESNQTNNQYGFDKSQVNSPRVSGGFSQAYNLHDENKQSLEINKFRDQ